MQMSTTTGNSAPISLEAYYQGRKALVTGGLGFIGSNVARRLVELGADVLVVDSLQANTGGNLANLKGVEDQLQVRLLDLRNCREFPDIVIGRDVIFNLAGQVSHLDSMTNPSPISEPTFTRRSSYLIPAAGMRRTRELSLPPPGRSTGGRRLIRSARIILCIR